ncbi:MAG: hypothetical protein U1F18_15685 [Steroidobacteraceae bacterium]
MIFITDIKVKAKQLSRELRLGSDEGKLRWGVGRAVLAGALRQRERFAVLGALHAASGEFLAARAYQQLGLAPYAQRA